MNFGQTTWIHCDIHKQWVERSLCNRTYSFLIPFSIKLIFSCSKWMREKWRSGGNICLEPLHQILGKKFYAVCETNKQSFGRPLAHTQFYNESGQVTHVQLIICHWENHVGRHSDSSINQLMLERKTECPKAQFRSHRLVQTFFNITVLNHLLSIYIVDFRPNYGLKSNNEKAIDKKYSSNIIFMLFKTILTVKIISCCTYIENSFLFHSVKVALY